MMKRAQHIRLTVPQWGEFVLRCVAVGKNGLAVRVATAVNAAMARSIESPILGFSRYDDKAAHDILSYLFGDGATNILHSTQDQMRSSECVCEEVRY
jgi:hypothetical protein